jgi:hypothetical protein
VAQHPRLRAQRQSALGLIQVGNNAANFAINAASTSSPMAILTGPR